MMQQKSTPVPVSGLVSITDCFEVNQVVEAIRLNGSDTSYVIFIVLKWLLSSNGSMTRTHLMAVFFRNETATYRFYFLKFIF